jgi:hypothetical protein
MIPMVVVETAVIVKTTTLVLESSGFYQEQPPIQMSHFAGLRASRFHSRFRGPAGRKCADSGIFGSPNAQNP